MWKNYFLTGWRYLVRTSGFSLINIFGLASGMTVAMLIGLWIYDELSFNTSFRNYHQLGQLSHHLQFGEEKFTVGSVPYPIGEALRSGYGEFTSIAMTSSPGEHILATDKTKITDQGMFVEPTFLEMFTVSYEGISREPLKDIHTIMLSQALADKLLGENPIGKTVKFDNADELMVTAVYEDFPANSAFAQVKMLVPVAYFFAMEESRKDMRDNWEAYDFECYYQLRPDADVSILNTQIDSLLYLRASDDARAMQPLGFLFPMERWHLHRDFADDGDATSQIRFVWMFGIIGSFVLLLACINFMNLSTARSARRSKEIGIRKVVGSQRLELIRQFLLESTLVAALSFIIAFFVVYLVLPSFNMLAGKKIELPLTDPWFYVISGVFVGITGLVAGSYPAFLLSSFSPVKVLKGSTRSRAGATPRKVMVVFQFATSMVLILGTAVVFLQIRHAKERPVGFDREGIIQVAIRTRNLARADYNGMREALLATGKVENMAKSNFPITGGMAADASLTWEGKDPAVHPMVALNTCSHDFPLTNGFQFVAGRDFDRQRSGDSTAVIINEMAASLFGGDVLGKKVTFGSGDSREIIGVVKDQIRWTPFSKQSPHLYLLAYGEQGSLTIRLQPGVPVADALAQIESVIKSYDPDAPFDFVFQDEQYSRLFHNEERLGKLAAIFSGLAIVISCIGILGLAAFAAGQRTKEIGIRKVLGASMVSLWAMLSKEFVVLVLMAMAVAFPLAYYGAGVWLQQYDYRVEVSWILFVTTGILSLLVTLGTVSYQALRAAWVNPVNSLRND